MDTDPGFYVRQYDDLLNVGAAETYRRAAVVADEAASIFVLGGHDELAFIASELAEHLEAIADRRWAA